MPGVLGLSIRGEEFGDEDTSAMMAEIARYKSTRDLVPDASLLGLTPQSGSRAGDGWDAVQLLSASSGHAVAYAFAGAGASPDTIIRLQGLEPGARYLVTGPDGQMAGSAMGAELMEAGIRVGIQPASAAVVLIVTKQAATPAPAFSPRP